MAVLSKNCIAFKIFCLLSNSFFFPSKFSCKPLKFSHKGFYFFFFPSKFPCKPLKFSHKDFYLFSFPLKSSCKGFWKFNKRFRNSEKENTLLKHVFDKNFRPLLPHKSDWQVSGEVLTPLLIADRNNDNLAVFEFIKK